MSEMLVYQDAIGKDQLYWASNWSEASMFCKQIFSDGTFDVGEEENRVVRALTSDLRALWFNTRLAQQTGERRGEPISCKAGAEKSAVFNTLPPTT